MSNDLSVYGDNYLPGLYTYTNTRIETAPIHPDYVSVMNVRLKVGDLVQTRTRQVGLIKGIEPNPTEGSMFIFGANNEYYKVMIGEQEKVHVGYSLKKI